LEFRCSGIHGSLFPFAFIVSFVWPKANITLP
jgi:hypothetical protein